MLIGCLDSGAGTIFGQGGRNGNAKKKGSLSNLNRVFCLRKQCSQKKGLRQISIWFSAQKKVLRRGQNISRGHGPLLPYFPRLCVWTWIGLVWVLFSIKKPFLWLHFSSPHAKKNMAFDLVLFLTNQSALNFFEKF